MQLKLLISFLLISLLSINTHAQEQKPFWLGVHGSRSFATTGDYFGLMTGVFLEKSMKKNGILGISLEYNAHTEQPVGISVMPTNDPSDNIDMSYRRVMSGLQLGIHGGKRFKIAKKHFLNTNVGPFVRVQYNSNDGYTLYLPQTPELPIPVFSFDNRFSPKQTYYAAGLKAVLQYQYQVSEKWRIGLHGSIQFDSQGDNFYNYGLTVATRFLR